MAYKTAVNVKPTIIIISLYNDPDNSDLISIDGSKDVPITEDILRTVQELLVIEKHINESKDNELKQRSWQGKYYRQKESKLKHLDRMVKGVK